MGVFMADLEHDRAAFNAVWQEHFGDQPPARFAIQVSGMGMPNDGTRFLADVIALDPSV
jgi:enamine deaminase RidA (YjgF/YER057c/UK114 family)